MKKTKWMALPGAHNKFHDKRLKTRIALPDHFLLPRVGTMQVRQSSNPDLVEITVEFNDGKLPQTKFHTICLTKEQVDNITTSNEPDADFVL